MVLRVEGVEALPKGAMGDKCILPFPELLMRGQAQLETGGGKQWFGSASSATFTGGQTSSEICAVLVRHKLLP